MKTEVTYQISDTNYGTKAVVNLPEGTFTLTLKYHNGINNQRVWTVEGNYPKDKWLISYEGGKLFILEKGSDDFKIGQEVNHKAFGKGVVASINDNMVSIKFDKGEKTMMKSILKNFLK